MRRLPTSDVVQSKHEHWKSLMGRSGSFTILIAEPCPERWFGGGPNEGKGLGMDEDTSYAHLKKMFDRVSTLARIGVWECALDSGRLTWTDMVYDIFGIPRGAPVDRETALQLYEPSSRREMERLRAEAIYSGTGFTLDVQIKPAVSEVRWVRLTALVEQEAGRPVRIFGTKQDVTREKAAQEKVQTLQTELIHLSRASAVGAMASTIAHELNQPLAAGVAYLSAARRIAPRENVSAELDQCIGGAIEAILSAGNIIRSVRAMTAQTDSKKENTELSSLVQEALALATAGVPHVAVSCELSPALFVFVDRIQIQQVVINLIRNASEATAGSACRVAIKAKAINSYVEVYVIDDGPGIPEDVIARVFDAFISTKSEGLGVGLSISRTIIEEHGGKIRAANLPNRGASVSFTLPKRSETATGREASPA
jgi:signal transduction histidine kinase